MITNIHEFNQDKFLANEEVTFYAANPIITINHTAYTIANKDKIVEANPEIKRDVDRISNAFAGFPDSVTILGTVTPAGFRVLEIYFRLRRFRNGREEVKEWRAGRIELEHLCMKMEIPLEKPIYRGRFSQRVLESMGQQPLLVRRGDRFYLKA
jgi:hypothetical protein